MGLTNEDREALCICAELAGMGSSADDDRLIAVCNAHETAVEQIIARHVAEARAAALSEAAELMATLLHDPECESCEDVRDCIAITVTLAAQPPP